MTWLTFYRELNQFEDILKDPQIKKHINETILWPSHCMIELDDNQDKLITYINLKYGDELRNELVPDRSPIPYKEYIPKRKN